jgi:5-methyltetrahydropteroyltriglutamate--homocysteine methyltransferase
MTIPTEPIGSIPRPLELLKAISQTGVLAETLESLYEEAVRDTIKEFEATGSPVVTATTREKPFAKIQARVEGTALGEEIINGR